MTTPILARRVMKARRETICPVCGEPIRVGMYIAYTDRWQHAACVIVRQRYVRDLKA